ncbi:MAG: response regulator transcription factor [Pseudomonadota bacterium]
MTPINVLIVDDHELTRSGLELLLKDTDYKICGRLHNGIEVTPYIQSECVDIIILDLCLPRLGGLTILAELVAVHDQTVLVLSGSNNAQEFSSALKLGARGVVSKSDPSATILEALKKALNGDTFISDTIRNRMIALEIPEVKLTPRQMAILQFMVEGESNKEIAYRLRISAPTVSFHLKEIRERLGAENNSKILEAARKSGLV